LAHNPHLRAFAKTWMKPLTLLALIAPAVWLGVQVWLVNSNMENGLGQDPAKGVHHFLGQTAIRVLLLTLAVSPIRDITGWAPIAIIRRRLGLAAFFYGVAHLIAYLWLEKNWSIPGLAKDAVTLTYVAVGLAALALMIPLALTSNNASIKKLGRRTWEKLHWLIFPLAILAVIHHALTLKGFYAEPMIQAAILAALLGWRLYRWTTGKLKERATAAA
jgi:sulfoxide reductase heme-binding subunit YedZ